MASVRLPWRAVAKLTIHFWFFKGKKSRALNRNSETDEGAWSGFRRALLRFHTRDVVSLSRKNPFPPSLPSPAVGGKLSSISSL